MAVHIVCVQHQGYKIIIQEILRKSGYFSTVLQNHFFSSPQKNIDYLDADPRSKDACFDKGGHQGLSSVSCQTPALCPRVLNSMRPYLFTIIQAPLESSQFSAILKNTNSIFFSLNEHTAVWKGSSSLDEICKYMGLLISTLLLSELKLYFF